MLVCRWCNARQPLRGSVRCSACQLPICSTCRRCQGNCVPGNPTTIGHRPPFSRRPIPTKRKLAWKAAPRRALPGLKPGVIRDLVNGNAFVADCERLRAEAKHRLDLRRRAAQAYSERARHAVPHALGDPTSVVRAPDQSVTRANRLQVVVARPGPEENVSAGQCIHGIVAYNCRICGGPGRFRRRYAGGPEGFR